MTDFKLNLLRLNEIDISNLEEAKDFINNRACDFNYLDYYETIFYFLDLIEISPFFYDLALYDPFCSYYAIRLRGDELDTKSIQRLENNFCTSGKISYSYSVNVLHNRFPKGEPAIIKDDYYKNVYLSFLKTLE